MPLLANKEWTIQDFSYHTIPEHQPCARQAGSTEVGSGRNAVALTGLFQVTCFPWGPGTDAASTPHVQVLEGRSS
jgi:hypothetical protein